MQNFRLISNNFGSIKKTIFLTDKISYRTFSSINCTFHTNLLVGNFLNEKKITANYALLEKTKYINEEERYLALSFKETIAERDRINAKPILSRNEKEQMQWDYLSPNPFLLYCATINELISKNKIDQAVETFNALSENGLNGSIGLYNLILPLASNKPGQVEKYFEEIKKLKLPLSVETYNGVIGSLSRQGDIKGVQHWFKVLESQENIKPNSQSYSFVIWALTQKLQMEEAEVWYKNMLDANIEPDLRTFNGLINGYGQSKQYDKYEDLVNQMTERNIVCTGSAIDLESARESNFVVDSTNWITNAMDNLELSNDQLSAAIKWLALNEHMELAVDSLNKMIDLNREPDPSIFQYIMEAALKSGDMTSAISYIENNEDEVPTGLTPTYMLELFKQKRVEKRLQEVEDERKKLEEKNSLTYREEELIFPMAKTFNFEDKIPGVSYAARYRVLNQIQHQQKMVYYLKLKLEGKDIAVERVLDKFPKIDSEELLNWKNGDKIPDIQLNLTKGDLEILKDHFEIKETKHHGKTIAEILEIEKQNLSASVQLVEKLMYKLQNSLARNDYYDTLEDIRAIRHKISDIYESTKELQEFNYIPEIEEIQKAGSYLASQISAEFDLFLCHQDTDFVNLKTYRLPSWEIKEYPAVAYQGINPYYHVSLQGEELEEFYRTEAPKKEKKRVLMQSKIDQLKDIDLDGESIIQELRNNFPQDNEFEELLSDFKEKFLQQGLLTHQETGTPMKEIKKDEIIFKPPPASVLEGGNFGSSVRDSSSSGSDFDSKPIKTSNYQTVYEDLGIGDSSEGSGLRSQYSDLDFSAEQQPISSYSDDQFGSKSSSESETFEGSVKKVVSEISPYNLGSSSDTELSVDEINLKKFAPNIEVSSESDSTENITHEEKLKSNANIDSNKQDKKIKSITDDNSGDSDASGISSSNLVSGSASESDSFRVVSDSGPDAKVAPVSDSFRVVSDSGSGSDSSAVSRSELRSSEQDELIKRIEQQNAEIDDYKAIPDYTSSAESYVSESEDEFNPNAFDRELRKEITSYDITKLSDLLKPEKTRQNRLINQDQIDRQIAGTNSRIEEPVSLPYGTTTLQEAAKNFGIPEAALFTLLAEEQEKEKDLPIKEQEDLNYFRASIQEMSYDLSRAKEEQSDSDYEPGTGIKQHKENLIFKRKFGRELWLEDFTQDQNDRYVFETVDQSRENALLYRDPLRAINYLKRRIADLDKVDISQYKDDIDS